MPKFEPGNKMAQRHKPVEPKPFNWTTRQTYLLQHWRQLIGAPLPQEINNLTKNAAITLRAQMNKVRYKHIHFEEHLRMRSADMAHWEEVHAENNAIRMMEVLLREDVNGTYKLVFQNVPYLEYTFRDPAGNILGAPVTAPAPTQKPNAAIETYVEKDRTSGILPKPGNKLF